MELNKIHNMDCLEGLKQMEDNSVDLVLTDPPYNMAIAEWDEIDDFLKFNKEYLSECERILKPNKALWIFGNHYSIHIVKNSLDSLSKLYFRNWVIWDKGVGIPNPNSLSNHHEQILYYIKTPDNDILKGFGEYIKKRRIELNLSLKKIGDQCGEKWYHRGGHLYFETGLSRPNVEQYLKLKEVLKLDDTYDIWFDNNFIFNLESIGVKWKYDKDKRNKRGWKNPGDIWRIPQLSGTFKERLNHPTQKPLKLIKQIIKLTTDKQAVVLDPFMGSGTTAVACKQLQRNYIGFEKERKYIEMANKRLEQGNLKQWFA